MSKHADEESDEVVVPAKRPSKEGLPSTEAVEIEEELRRRRRQPIPEQGKWLARVVRGYFAYHAVPTNSAAIRAFRHYVVDLWRRSLSRRSQKGGNHLGTDQADRR